MNATPTTHLCTPLQYRDSPIRSNMLNRYLRGILHRRTLFAGEEITLVHVCHVRSTCLTPNTHLMSCKTEYK